MTVTRPKDSTEYENITNTLKQKPFDLILNLFWTENMSAKYLSGFCTSAKTHSLHNLQSKD